MICPSCDALLADGTRFCTACGFRIVADAADRTPAQTASELLDGTSLREIAAKAPLHWRRVFELLEQICLVVIEARARGILNPEIDPDSIYVEHQPGSPWRVKLAEVTVEIMRGSEPRDTATGRETRRFDKYGRPMPSGFQYYPPERIMGQLPDASSDVFKLGLVAYELLTGMLPFPTDQGPARLITAMLKTKAVAPSVIQSDIPTEVDAIVLRCLNAARVDRYPGVYELAREVAGVLGTSSAASSDVN
jgi:eukaryotic-like serine/threonine-protein kinase